MHGIMVLVVTLILIVFISIAFCNALEHLGEHLGVSDGVTGSIFAAVGTALPETIMPILAIFASKVQVVNFEISVGTILGAPLMLSTLSVFIMALFVIFKRGIHGRITPEISGITRDLRFFFCSYTLALIAAIVPSSWFGEILKITIALTLLISYFIYVLLTIKNSKKQVDMGYETVATSRLYIQFFGTKANLLMILVQLIFALLVLIYFAQMFIDSVHEVAYTYKVPVFLLALIVVPIATELPEKINSVLWLRTGKDTLALSNITGALVFQGTLLPVIGILFSNWNLTSRLPLIAIALTMLATAWLYKNASKGKLKVWHFMINGLIYAVNLMLCSNSL